MSTETIVSCDRCRSQIEMDRTNLVSTCAPRYAADRLRSIDLCPKCLADLLQWLVTTPDDTQE